MKLFIAFLAFVFCFAGVVASQQPFVTDIAGGASHSMVLKSDGTVVTWGRNSEGQLGNGNFTASHTPQTSAFAGGVAIAAGGYFSLMLRFDGTVWACGENNFSELGTGVSSISQPTPVQVVGLSQVIAIAGGLHHALALKADGTVWVWGEVRGLGNFSAPFHPQTPLFSGAVAIAAGFQHSLVLKADGTVWAWGDNGFGQLGVGVNNQVSGLSQISKISASTYHSMALTSGGNVFAWGRGENGELGNGTTANSNIPIQVSGLSGVTAIVAKGGHSLALKSDGTLWAWGRNDHGELGNGNTINSPIPVAVMISNVIATGKIFGSHCIALKSDNTVWVWGLNDQGQLGNGASGSFYPNPTLFGQPPPPPNFFCSAGNVNSANGTPADILLINGSAGNASRIVNVGINTSIAITLASPPAGPNSSFAIVWGWIGYPTTPTTLNAFGQNLGCTVNPTSFLSTLAPQPSITIPVYTPAVDGCPAGFPTPGVATLQGMIIDFGASNASFFSITNAVILNVQ